MVPEFVLTPNYLPKHCCCLVTAKGWVISNLNHFRRRSCESEIDLQTKKCSITVKKTTSTDIHVMEYARFVFSWRPSVITEHTGPEWENSSIENMWKIISQIERFFFANYALLKNNFHIFFKFLELYGWKSTAPYTAQWDMNKKLVYIWVPSCAITF